MQPGSTVTVANANGSSELDTARRDELELHGCGMDQTPHIAGRNLNASGSRTVLRESVIQRLNNTAEVGISAVLQFGVIENHYGAISTSTTVLRDYELFL